MTGDEGIPVSVIVPTIGRPSLLRECLASIALCRPAPDEVLVVDQSGSSESAVEQVIADFAGPAAWRRVQCEGRGVALALNVGLGAASHEVVLVTHDDCTVASSWVGVAVELVKAAPTCIYTGRVLPDGEASAIPSTKTDTDPRDYTKTREYGVLFPNNMVLGRSAMIEFGGFDEMFTAAGEDNDLCYRWLRAGKCLRYEPELVVWHRDWRSRDQLKSLYLAYGRAQGRFYAKHLSAGDLRMLSLLASDLRAGVRSLAAAIVYRRPAWSDPRRGLLRGIPVGLVRGWLERSRT